MNVAQERAEADLRVGKASAGGCRFEVEDGLAVVRQASAGRLVLWAGAPTVQLNADCAADATLDWSIELRNAMPGIEAEVSSGASVRSDLEGGIATRSSWAVTLPAGSRTWVRWATADAKSAEPWRFAFVSDIQNSGHEQDIFDRVNEDPSIRFVLGGGDLTSHGQRKEYAEFEQELLGLRVPHFTTLGNHELGESPTLFHEWFGRCSFSFAYHDTQLTLVDSASATLDPMVYDWLEGWLKEGRARVHVFATHMAPIDPVGERNGSFASRNEAAKLLRMLAAAGVDLTLYGHVHSSYSFENAGIPAWVSGGGGAIPERFDGIGRHFLSIDIAPGVGVTSVAVMRVD